MLLACLAASPVAAAPAIDARCDDSSEALLDAATAELNARPASTGDEALEGHLLEQRLDAATRSVFADDEAKATEDAEEAAADAPPAEAGGPAASEQEPSPFRRPMYRRDI